MKPLTLQVNATLRDQTVKFRAGNIGIVMTPPIDQSYWMFRVPLYNEQAVVAFPKFGTYGIGFQYEDDWNTNLPYTSGAEEILNHIWENHKYKEITKERTLMAIKLLQKACHTEESDALVIPSGITV